MATSFDSLGYARHLRERGVPQEQAEAMPDAARTCLMQELLMREDLRLALDDLALRLTVRTGVMIAAAVGILGTLDALMAPQRRSFDSPWCKVSVTASKSKRLSTGLDW